LSLSLAGPDLICAMRCGFLQTRIDQLTRDVVAVWW
jgi:hypothetical protein